MKYLIIYSHFNDKSFSKAICEKVENILQSRKDEVRIIDLHKEDFNPIFDISDALEKPQKDILKYQDLISWADSIIIVYPLWWSQMPAMLKGFLDRVLTNGFAFDYSEKGVKGLLDKDVKIFVNTGNYIENLKKEGIISSIENINSDGIFGFCGMRSQTIFFGGVTAISDEKRKEYLSQIENII